MDEKYKMAYGEKLSFERLIDTFHRNFRITELYARMLERFPDIITGDMINALTEDGRIKKTDAIAALLAEIFSFDESNSEDKILLRDYIMPSVRILNPERYTENPYYKNIKLPDIKDGAWEFKNESYPAYRAVISGDMIINEDFSEVPPLGFFEEEFRFPAVLEDGNEWMTLTPVDLDTCDEAIEKARGKVITFGLGLGYYAYMAARKPDVTSVTVIEKSEGVIELFKKYILPQFEEKAAAKLRIICADAFEYAEHKMPNEAYDIAFVDTWRDASDGAPMYKKMKALEPRSPKTEFLYWIENFLVSRIRAESFTELRDKYQKGELYMSYEKIKKILSEQYSLQE